MAESEVLRRLEESTGDARRVQVEALRSILEANADAAYLQRYLAGHLPDTLDAAAFRRLVPLSSYDDYTDIIARIADGVEPPSSLSLDPLLCFFYSSGTSNLTPKLIPFFDSSHAKSASNLAHQGSSALLRRLFPPRQSVNKILWFLYSGDVTETKGGFKVMAASAYPFHNKSPSPSPLLSMIVSPPQVVLGSDNHQQMYCHLLCGLRNSASVDGIRAPYAAGLVRAFRLLESKWEQLCDDIESGLVNPEITNAAMRDAVQELLGGPQPEMAKRIREVCGKMNWKGILGELWPEVRYVACVTTGSMEQYYPILKYYAGENVPLLCGDYFASECAVGINMDRIRPPDETSFVILPNAAYFEFLPFEMGASSEAKQTVDICGVEVGKMYEVVATTYRGLYRYRLGDVVKVVGFYNSSPKVQFITRAPKGASEIFTERELMSGMETFQRMLRDGNRGEVVEFAGFLDPGSGLKHVIIFVEVSKDCILLQGENLEGSNAYLRRCCSSIEGCFGSVYRVKRADGDLGPVQISIVKPGSFDSLAELAMESGAPANQYKPPKVIRHCGLADLLKASVVLTASFEGN